MKKIYLSNTDKKLGGVLGGIGETFSVDPTLLRLIFVFVSILTGIIPGIVTYFIAWLIIPEKSTIM